MRIHLPSRQDLVDFYRNAGVKNLDSAPLRRLAERVARNWEVPLHPFGRVRIMKVS
jgi:hypothetical protein